MDKDKTTFTVGGSNLIMDIDPMFHYDNFFSITKHGEKIVSIPAIFDLTDVPENLRSYAMKMLLQCCRGINLCDNT